MSAVNRKLLVAIAIGIVLALLFWTQQNRDKTLPQAPTSAAPDEPRVGTESVSIETEKTAPVSNYEVPKTVRYRFIATNKTGEILENVNLAMFSPMQSTSTQQQVDLQSNESFRIEEDGLGNRVMQFSIEKLPPYASRIINVESRLLMTAEPRESELESTEYYLQDARLFDLDDEEIINTAQKLRQQDPHSSARAIYDWVKNYMSYSGYIASDRGAAYAMRTGRGDCTEYAYLLAALARNNGIPARIMAGFVYANNAILRPSDYHNWVELYVDGRWQIADPLNNYFFADKTSHIALRVIGGDGPLNYLASQKGIEADARLEVKMQ